MLKKFLFIRQFVWLFFILIFFVGVFAGVAEATRRSFQWENDNTCPEDMTCSTIVYVWELDYYCTVVPSDCTYDTRRYSEVPGGKGVFVPEDSQDTLKANAIDEVVVLPESYDTVSININNKIFSLPYDTKFVAVIVAYERKNTETVISKLSKFSNRVMLKTPKKLDFDVYMFPHEISDK